MLNYDKRRTKTKVGSGQTLDEDEPTTWIITYQTIINNELGQILEQDEHWMRQTSNSEQKSDQDNFGQGESLAQGQTLIQDKQWTRTDERQGKHLTVRV